MVRAMRLREVETALKRHNCWIKSDEGIHTKWVCPCDKQHTAPIPRHRDVSPGVVRKTIQLMKCLPDGWLQ
jgi:hypothetical protein